MIVLDDAEKIFLKLRHCIEFEDISFIYVDRASKKRLSNLPLFGRYEMALTRNMKSIFGATLKQYLEAFMNRKGVKILCFGI